MTKAKRVIAASVVLALGMSVNVVATQPAMASGSGAAPNVAFASFDDAEPGVAPPGLDATAIYLDGAGRPLSVEAVPASSMDAAAFPCTPLSGRDNPHTSSGDVSGHGWWQPKDCDGNLADVYNCLYEWYTDNSWRQKACSTLRRLRPYTGSGDRTTARRACSNSLRTSWRNHVDVDVVNEWDTGEWPYNQADPYCRVY